MTSTPADGYDSRPGGFTPDLDESIPEFDGCGKVADDFWLLEMV